MMEPVQDNLEEVPVCPLLLLAVETTENFILPIPMVTDYEDNPKELLNSFIEELVKLDRCPDEIRHGFSTDC